MIITDFKTYRIQRPDIADGWLYKDYEDGVRIFVREVSLPNFGDAVLWNECTDGSRKGWEATHRPERTQIHNNGVQELPGNV